MSPLLQAALNNVGPQLVGNTGPVVNVSSGRLLDDKLVVLAYLFCTLPGAQYFAFPNPTVSGAITRCAALQGLTNDNMLDLMISGMAFRCGFRNTTWDDLVSTAKAALDGQAGLSPYDYTTLINFCLLYFVAGVQVI